jgi:nucleoside-diphosphate-sugar epimerase
VRDARRFRFVEADLREADLVPLVADADAVLHLAAMPGNRWDLFDLYMTCNLKGTERWWRRCASPGRASGGDWCRSPPRRSTARRRAATSGRRSTRSRPYGITKLAAEQLALAYGASFGLQVVVLRYFSIYGPGSAPTWRTTSGSTRCCAGADRDPGDGEQTRGNTYIDDGVTGTLLALAHGRAGEIYNIGGGVPISMNAAITTLEELTGRVAERRYRPARLGDQRHTFADIGKAREHFGYAPRVAPADGLRAQVAWQRAKSRRDKVASRPVARYTPK